MRPAIAGTSTSAPERPATFIEAPARISTPAATEKPILMANEARSAIALRNSKSGYHGLRLGKHVALLNSAPASMTVSELLRIADHLDRKDQEIVRRAYERALAAHAGQRRLSGEEYVNHPMEVAAILADLERSEERRVGKECRSRGWEWQER